MATGQQATQKQFPWTPPPPKEEAKPWAPVGNTFHDLAVGVAKSAADIVNYVGGVEGNTVGNIRQVKNKALRSAAGTLKNVGETESNLTQPVRQEAMETAWRLLQQLKYFYGFPYSTKSYQDEIKLHQQTHGGTLPPGPHSQYLSPGVVGPQATTPEQQLTQLWTQGQATTPAVPTQAATNQQWMDYWNKRGPRPAAGTIYKP